MPVQNFKLVNEFISLQRRAMSLVDPSILQPLSANPLVMGEWLEMATGYKVARGTGDAGANVLSWAWFAEQGRYETQALGKGPLLWGGEYEADTKIMDATGITTPGQALMVGDVTIGGLTRRGLLLRTGTNAIVGRVTRVSTENGGFLRFVNWRF